MRTVPVTGGEDAVVATAESLVRLRIAGA